MQSRLKTYALTAGGTAALVAANAATAGIVSSDGAISIAAGDTETLFYITSGGSRYVRVAHQAGGSWSGSGAASASVSVNGHLGLVTSGATIGEGFTGSASSRARNYMFFYDSAMSTNYSTVLSIGDSLILGFAISNGPDVFYAWVNYSLSMDLGVYTWTINSWAYNDVAGEGIIAGQNLAEGSNAVPGLGGLAALAIGAAGVRSRRQRTVA